MKNVTGKSMEMYRKMVSIFVLSLIMPTYTFCQTKIKDFSAIETEVQKGSDSFKNIAMYYISAVLAVALIFVVWEIASGKNNAKDHLIGWIIAVGVVILAGFII